MRGFSKRKLLGTRLTCEDKRARSNYLRIQNFTTTIKNSGTLTNAQKSQLWQRARDGDLEGAEQEYKQIVSVRR